MEVLQICPSQQRALLFDFRVVDPNASTIVRFETHKVQPRFPYHVVFLVHVECLNNTIKCTVIDEGVAVLVMSLSCWKGPGLPTLLKSMTMLTTFDGCSFQPHDIIPSL